MEIGMLESVRRCLAGHRDASRLVRDAKRFSVNVPMVGKVSVPPPDHLAFYGVLGMLSVTELIPWPVAVGLGAGHALTVRRAREEAAADLQTNEPVMREIARESPLAVPPRTKTAVTAKELSTGAATTKTARKAPAKTARKAPAKTARKAAAKTTASRTVTAGKAPTKTASAKTAASATTVAPTPAKKAPAKRTTPRKSAGDA